MQTQKNHYFLKCLVHLQAQQELMLFSKLYAISPEEDQAVIDFLAALYKKEALDHPFQAPAFNEEAALWGAKTFYHCSQLLINRAKPPKELAAFLSNYEGEINASSILSADLYLRFIPIILLQAQDIDPEDELIVLLESILTKWHYSGVGYLLKEENLDFAPIVSHSCLHQLYVNRVIEKKAQDLSQHPALVELVKASVGNYQKLYLT